MLLKCTWGHNKGELTNLIGEKRECSRADQLKINDTKRNATQQKRGVPIIIMKEAQTRAQILPRTSKRVAP